MWACVGICPFHPRLPAWRSVCMLRDLACCPACPVVSVRASPYVAASHRETTHCPRAPAPLHACVYPSPVDYRWPDAHTQRRKE
eukprot:33955-Eustigmatos_ZCMA.PRE.1